MGKRPPEKYAPGELQKTRETLGDISRDEAKRMAEMLGGEVGVERTDRKIEDQYKRLKEKSPSRAVSQPSYSRNPPPLRSSSGRTETQSAPPSPAGERDDRHTPFFERIKMNFLAAHPDHMIMRRSDAIASVFSFLFHKQEYINPDFIKQGDALFFRHIESLVLAIRSLLAINKKSQTQRMRPSFYFDVLTVLKNWDIESLHWELTQLQKRPRRLPLASCDYLCGLLFKPIMMLIRLDPYTHIEGALKRLVELDLLTVAKKSPEEEKIQHAYFVAREEIPYLFQDIKYTCYPLLMKLVSTKFFPYELFFGVEFSNILSFLELTPDQILSPKKLQNEQVKPEEEKEKVSSAEADFDEIEIEEEQAEDEQSGEELPDEAETAEKSENGNLLVQLPPEVANGLEMLDMLFPHAGWKHAPRFPDFYAYFQPLFDYSRGTELIPPEDPFLQVIVLVSILQELFYGFRAVQFGTIEGEQGKYLDLQNSFEEYLDSWHCFIDEILSKHYASQLYEYCRQVERSLQFKASTYGRKLAADLMWIKRLYFMPYVKFEAVRGARPTLGSHLPKLFQVCSELKNILGRVVVQIDKEEPVNITGVKNWKKKYSFEIQNPVSRRLKYLLNRDVPVKFRSTEVPNESNATLLLYTLSVLTVLDYLINDPESYCNKAEDTPLYRSEHGNSQTPLYSVSLMDTDTLLKESEQAQLGLNKEESGNRGSIDGLTGLFTIEQLSHHLKEQIEEYHLTKTPFSCIGIDISDFTNYNLNRGREAGDRVLKEAGDVLRRTISPFSGIGFRGENDEFYCILPRTERRSSLSAAITFSSEFIDTFTIPIAVGIVEFHKTWGAEKMRKVVDKTVERTKQVNRSAVGVYNSLQQETTFIDPITRRQIEEEEGV